MNRYINKHTGESVEAEKLPCTPGNSEYYIVHSIATGLEWTLLANMFESQYKWVFSDTAWPQIQERVPAVCNCHYPYEHAKWCNTQPE